MLIDYNHFAGLVRQAVSIRLMFQGRWPRVDAYASAALSRHLARIEEVLASALVLSGVSPDAAQQSALAFVSGCVAHYLPQPAPCS